MSGFPVTVVESGGYPVTQVASGAAPASVVDAGGLPITLVAYGGTPMVLEGGFSPSSLFASGEEGVMFDVTATDSMAQTSAGAGNPGSDSPIGLLGDSSGNGNDARQATASSRPRLRRENGMQWLEFDGVNDSLATAAIDMSASDAVTVFAAVRKFADDGLRTLAESSANAGSNSGAFRFLAPNDANPNYGYRAGGTSLSATAAAPFPAGTANVVTMQNDISAATLSIRVDGAEVNTSGSSQGTGNLGNYPVYIGSRAGSSLFFKGDLFALVVINRVCTPQEIEDMETWLARKCGVSL